MSPKIKMSGGRKSNTKSFTFEDIKNSKQFIVQYAIVHALLLPGRTPGFKRDGVSLLPSSETKVKVHNAYIEACKEKGWLKIVIYQKKIYRIIIHYLFLGVRCMGLTTFKEIWLELMPFIITAKPMTDLCSTCQLNNTLIYRSKNMEESKKSKKLKEQMV